MIYSFLVNIALKIPKIGKNIQFKEFGGKIWQSMVYYIKNEKG